MNRYGVIQAFAVACLFFAANKCYAWNQEPHAVIANDDPTWVHINYELCFDGWDSYDPDGWIFNYRWFFQDGQNRYGNGHPPDCDGGYKVLHAYAKVGPYQPSLWVYDDGNPQLSGRDDFTVYAVSIGIGAERGYVAVNNDDDDQNGKMDKYDGGTQDAEDDLVELQLSVSTPRTNDTVKLCLTPETCYDCIKFWTHRDKREEVTLTKDKDSPWYVQWTSGGVPETLYVEGIKASPDVPDRYPSLSLIYIDGYGQSVPRNPPAQIGLTVLHLDMDMDGCQDADYPDLYPSEVTAEIIPGAFVPLNDVVKITLREPWPKDQTLLPIDAGHPVTLRAISGGSKIQIWENGSKTGDPVSLPATYTSRSQFPKDLWVEGINVSSYPRDIALAMEYTIASHTFDDRINLTVYALEKVEFEAYMDNDAPDNHPDLPPNGGKRIFPDKKTYNDSYPERRKIVTVNATITPVLDNRHVYFKSFDVDDPNSDSAPIDGNGSVGGDNRGGAGSLSETEAVTDGSGDARVRFTVTMNPGDNFRIAAALSEDKLTPTALTQQMADANTPPAGVKFSPMVTVWRKLWIERDSMGAVASSGPEKNYVSGTASSYQDGRAYLGQNLPDELDDEDQFDSGGYRPTNKPPYLVWYNSSHLIAEDYADVRGDPNADGAAMTYDLFDDDYYPGTSQPRVTLPSYPGLDSYAGEFARAYIETIYLTDQQDIVSFNRNLSYLEIEWGQGDWNDHFGCPPSADFWSVLSVTCFQPTSSKDGDPETQVYLGEAHPSRNDLALYLEVIENEDPSDVSRIMAHEIGHTGGLEDCDTTGCIMEHGDQFCDHCLSDMRANGSGW